MNLSKQRLLARLFRRPEPGDDGAGEVIDRGDDFTPTEDDEPEVKAPAKVEKPLPKDKASALKELGKAATTPPGEDEPEDEPEEDAPVEDKKKNARIPLARHEAILAKERDARKALEAQIKGFQGQAQIVQTNDQITSREAKVLELTESYNKALTDGETKEASALMAQIRRLDREISNLESDVKVAAAEARATENARYNIALERIEATYPQLDEDSDEYDEGVYKEVVLLMRAYRGVGLTPTEALQKAVRKELGAASSKEKDVTSVKPKVDADAIRAERKRDATGKALDAKEKSPPTATAKTGINSNDAGAARTAKDVIKMSQKDFAALDERELARLRGDEVEEAS